MIRKAIICLLASTLLSSTLYASAAIAAPSSKCSRIGATKTVKSLKYTCVKSGRKIVWGKPKKVVKDKSKDQSLVVTLAPLSRTAPINSSSSSNSGSSESAPVITFDNLNTTWTSKVSRSELVTEFNKLRTPTDVVEIFAGPNVISSDLNEEQRLLRIATRMFSNYYLPARYKAVYFSQTDGVWAEGIQTIHGGGGANSIQTEIARWPDGCNFAFATTGFSSIPMYYQCMDTRGRSIFDKQTAIHEYFHS